MRQMFRSRLGRAIAAAAMLAAAATVVTAVQAATVSIGSVTGAWTSATPGNTTNLSGLGTNTISWGTGHPQGGFRQSAYSFTGPSATPITLTPGQQFQIGTFTHDNWAIALQPTPFSITGASLQLTFDLLVGGVSQTLTQVYDFTHWETPNLSAPCADGGANGVGVNVNGCADRVQAVINPALSQSFTFGSQNYLIDITAFQGFATDANGTPTFWTVENRTNSANILASLTVTDIPPPPTTVPLPAAGLLLTAAFGGLAITRRRR